MSNDVEIIIGNGDNNKNNDNNVQLDSALDPSNK